MAIIESTIYKVGIPIGANCFGIFSRWYRVDTVTWDMLATTVSNTRIDLTWDDNFTDEDGFSIERSTNGSTWTVINTPAANAVSYSSTGLTADTTYYYRIRANKGSIYTSYSNISSAKTNAAP
jgi:titin